MPNFISLIYEALSSLIFYSGCDEIKITFDGNLIGLHFYWNDTDQSIHAQFFKDTALEHTIDEFINSVMVGVNLAKREKGIK